MRMEIPLVMVENVVNDLAIIDAAARLWRSRYNESFDSRWQVQRTEIVGQSVAVEFTLTAGRSSGFVALEGASPARGHRVGDS